MEKRSTDSMRHPRKPEVSRNSMHRSISAGTRIVRQGGSLFLLHLLLVSSSSYSQVFLDADSTGNAYARITSKGYGLEVPDVLHPVKHIAEPWDSLLRKHVFEFALHKDIDGDSNERIDRQRNEIKTYGPSPENMKASYGETHTYRWKFKLDAGFLPSSQFCHIHQIKAGDGPDAASPLMTLTPRAGSPDKLELIFTAPSGGSGGGKLKIADLTPFKGTWVEAYEKIKFTESGTYSITLRRVSDDSLLLIYSNNGIAMWRTGSTFIRPKYGIYRSLGSDLSLVPRLRDELVRFADISLAEGETSAPPQEPGGLRASAVSRGQINLSWTEHSSSEDQFRIDRSMDGATWSYRATARANQTSYSDTGLTASTLYYYRIRSENVFGNSDFSNVSTATTQGTTGVIEHDPTPGDFEFLSYPNPFNPRTEIQYRLPEANHVRLVIHDISGRHVETLIDGYRAAGTYRRTWDTSRIHGTHLVSGTYLASITVGNHKKSIRLLLIK